MTKKDLLIWSGGVSVAGIIAVGEYYEVDWRAYVTLIGYRFFYLALTIAAGFVVGAALSPKFERYRRLLMIGAVFLTVLFGMIVPTELADFLGFLIKAVACIVAFYFGISLGRIVKEAVERTRPTSYGSAKWATQEYLAEHGLFSESGFLLGTFVDGDHAVRLRYAGARHLLTVAPTRSGKGVSSIIPNLLLHPGSALVIDPKGENALITACRRGGGDNARNLAGLGQRIVLLDPWDIAASSLKMSQAKFNPLDWIRADDPDAAENAFLLAEALVIKEGSGENSFWDEEAKALLTGIILFVATAEGEAGKRHLGRVRDILTLDDETFESVLRQMYKHPNPLVSSTASRTAGKDAKLRGNVLASAQAHTHFLESPRIRESLSSSDFNFADLKSDDVTVYLILPADRLSTFNRWLRLLIQQAIMVNARNIHVKPKAPILFMLDEMPTLGRLPSLEQAFGLMAGFGMQLWGIVQDLSQLANIYGEHGWQTFISNSGVIQYFGSRDKMTAEYFSSLCGVTTIEVHNLSWAVGQVVGYSSSSSTGAGGGSSSSSSSNSSSWTRTNGVSEAQRQLAYPDELMVLKGEEQIVFVENLDPILGEKIVWYKDEAMLGLGNNIQNSTSHKLSAPGYEVGQT